MIGIPSPGSTGKEADRAESRTLAVFDYCTRGEYLLTLLPGNKIYAYAFQNHIPYLFD